MAQSTLINLPAEDITIVDNGLYYESTNIENALQEIGPTISLLETGNATYNILSALPTVEEDLFEGMIVYETTGHTLNCLTTPGEQEIDTVTVTAGAVTKLGDITITLNEEDVVVPVAHEDTAIVVATKIKAAVDAAVLAETIDAWTTSRVGAVLTFKRDEVSACAAPTVVDTGTTGCTFSAFARTNQGVDSVWGVLINA